MECNGVCRCTTRSFCKNIFTGDQFRNKEFSSSKPHYSFWNFFHEFGIQLIIYQYPYHFITFFVQHLTKQKDVFFGKVRKKFSYLKIYFLFSFNKITSVKPILTHLHKTGLVFRRKLSSMFSCYSYTKKCKKESCVHNSILRKRFKKAKSTTKSMLNEIENICRVHVLQHANVHTI